MLVLQCNANCRLIYMQSSMDGIATVMVLSAEGQSRDIVQGYVVGCPLLSTASGNDSWEDLRPL
jgi:hypothetical protein